MDKIINEIWKPIKGFEGLYEVSNLGRVKSVDRTVVRKDGRNCFYKGHIVAFGKKKSGYRFVGLSKNSTHKYYHVHRLVAEAFIPNPDNLPQVNHKDEDKTNNTVDNLEWCTQTYNVNYGTAIERMAKALCMTVYQYELDGKTLVREWSGYPEIERVMGWKRNSICNCVKGWSKVSHGFKWSHTPLT